MCVVLSAYLDLVRGVVAWKKRKKGRSGETEILYAYDRTYIHIFHILASPFSSFPQIQYLYTLSVSDIEKAEKLTQSLPPGLQRKDI